MRIKSLFTVPEGERVTEKAFGKVLLSSVCSILLCMACLIGTTWAWFRADLENMDNLIQTADVKTEVIVGNPKVDPQDGVYILNSGSYSISLKVTSDGSRKDDFGLKNVYMTMTVFSGTSDASAVSEDPSTPSTTPTVSAAPGIYTFCMHFGEQDSSGYRVATREITLNVPEEGARVTFALSWVQPSGSGAALVNEDPAVIGDAPATDPTETTAPPESTGTDESSDPSESTGASEPPVTSEPPAIGESGENNENDGDETENSGNGTDPSVTDPSQPSAETTESTTVTTAPPAETENTQATT